MFGPSPRIMSAPSPPRIVSLPSPPAIPSRPLPPTIRSLPRPPSIMSLPDPPPIRSSYAPVTIRSLPLPPDTPAGPPKTNPVSSPLPSSTTVLCCTDSLTPTTSLPHLASISRRLTCESETANVTPLAEMVSRPLAPTNAVMSSSP